LVPLRLTDGFGEAVLLQTVIGGRTGRCQARSPVSLVIP
jgi:hypothetical protein